MSLMDDIPPSLLADALEKLIAKMDERELAQTLELYVDEMAPAARAALVEAIFDVFRDRGESSEDAAEEAGTSVAALERCVGGAVNALLEYGVTSTGVVKAALVTYGEEHPELVRFLPPQLVDRLSERLAAGS